MKATETMVTEILSTPKMEYPDMDDPIEWTNSQLADLFLTLAQTIDAMRDEILALSNPEQVPFGDGEMGAKVLEERAKKLTTKDKVLKKIGLS